MSETETLRHRLEQWLARQVATNLDDCLDAGDCRCCGTAAGYDHEPTDPCGLIADSHKRITDLEAQVSALEKNLHDTTLAWAAAADDRDEANGLLRAAEAQVSALTAQVERYGAALTSIANNSCCASCGEAALVAQRALIDDRCEWRYPVPGPRSEPFEVTYRCGKARGHTDPHGPPGDPVSPAPHQERKE